MKNTATVAGALAAVFGTYVGFGWLADHLPTGLTIIIGGYLFVGTILLVSWLDLRKGWEDAD